MNQIVLHDNVHDLIEISERLGLVDEQLSELQALVRVDAHDASQQVDVVRREVDLDNENHS